MKDQPHVFVRMDRCAGCRSCELACAVAHSETKTLAGAINESRRPQKRIFVEAAQSTRAPILCRHCEDAPCVRACPTGAMLHDDASGLVEHVESRCIGCSLCSMACPFGVIQQNRNHYSVIKCDRCPGRDVPACVEACPTRALQLQPEYEKARRREVVERITGAMRMGAR